MIFFDNNATAPIIPEVVAAMMQELDGIPRNPSSITSYGREGRARIANVRHMIAEKFGVLPDEVIFTSGATESNLMLIQGFSKLKPGHVVTTQIEHSCVLRPIEDLSCEKTFLSVDSSGAVTPAQVEEAIKPTTSFIFLTGANNETGVKIDLDAMCQIAQALNIPLLIDGVVLLGRENLFSLHPKIAAISFSGHKIHAPKGIGIAIVRKKYRIAPLFKGGYQEHGMRAGTENTPAILGLGKAIELIDESIFSHMCLLRDTFERRLRELNVPIEINGSGPRVPNTASISFTDKDAELMMIKLDQAGLIASVGSACSAGTIYTSHVLRGMGFQKNRIYGSIRFSFSRLNTLDEVEKGALLIKNICS